jgi:tetratricopeptide (TPR) repeat protein
MDYNIRKLMVLACAVAALFQSGCAGSLTHWMVNLRTSQGDAALAKERPDFVEAEKEYKLALALDPKNVHARAGFAKSLYLVAKEDFANSKLDEASTEIAEALKYAPSDAATLALANEIDQAKIRREIVVANYPLYGSIIAALKPVFKQVTASNKEIEAQVKAFSNDFDTAHLTKAIVESYDLEDEAHRTAARLITYRGLVQSGQEKTKVPSQGEAPSLLPIP